MDFIDINELTNTNPNINTNINTNTNITQTIPNKIFIVPYRSRVQHKFFLSKYMTFLLEDEAPGSYEIYFSHQCDNRPFNRGATKNIGFLAMKQKYPNDYKNISFIFNDVDTLPFNKIFNYETTVGVVTHLYGFNFALGGIVIFKGSDFERINGYPNYWGWGMEDNVLQQRCLKNNLEINRSQFFQIGSPEILQLFDGIKRLVVRDSHAHAKDDNGFDGLNTIHQLCYTINAKSYVPADNENYVDNPYIYIINITYFLTLMPSTEFAYENYDLRDVRQPSLTKNIMSMNTITNLSSAPQQTNKNQNKKTPQLTPIPNNKYSPDYSAKMGFKERATTSINIRMGGLLK